MKSKKSVFTALVSVLFILLSLPATGSARNWKTGGVANPDTLEHRTLEKWVRLVKEKTNGEIVIDAFPSEQLGPYRDMFDNVVRGVQESGLLPLSPEFDKRLQVGYTVFLAENWDQGRKVWSSEGWMFNLLKPIFNELGVQPLGVFFMGLDGFASTKGPVVLPSDIRKFGIKVRTWNPADRLFFQEMGAQTVDIAFSELFTSLQTGVVHAQDNAPLITYEHLRDVTKFYTDVNLLFEPVVLMINKELWDKQSPAVQKAIQDAATEALAWGNGQAESVEKEYFKKMEDSGIQVIHLTDEQRAQWKEYGIKSWDKFEEIIGKKAMDQIRMNIQK
ncbi:TRAP transporter substrate-binding protein [Desulfospira joergensenii]|uniref:TRAP transporter substrate-binding protein n=1 Tax=Desulfospira joergensenii TaxID=53329 RepID=UPI0003B69552|nr:TRAP transporter substrate-binding protein DctP [Desulfospira joergensenii]